MNGPKNCSFNKGICRLSYGCSIASKFQVLFSRKVLSSRWSSNQIVSRKFCSTLLNLHCRMSCVCPLVFYPCKLKMSEILAIFGWFQLFWGQVLLSVRHPRLQYVSDTYASFSVSILSWWELTIIAESKIPMVSACAFYPPSSFYFSTYCSKTRRVCSYRNWIKNKCAFTTAYFW